MPKKTPVAKPITIEERIEMLMQQGNKAEQDMIANQTIVTKCQGAIEVLQSMIKEKK